MNGASDQLPGAKEPLREADKGGVQKGHALSAGWAVVAVNWHVQRELDGRAEAGNRSSSVAGGEFELLSPDRGDSQCCVLSSRHYPLAVSSLAVVRSESSDFSRQRPPSPANRA